MKKIVSFILLLGLSSYTTVVLSQTPRLTFRFSNPRIIYTTNQTLGEDCDNLQFDVDVKCDSANTEYFGMQINLTVDATALDLSGGTFDFTENSALVPSAKYGYILGFTAGQMNVFIYSKNTSPTDNTKSHFTIIPPSYTKIGTFVLKILDPLKVAGINFIASGGPAYMDGEEVQKLFNPPNTRIYSNPNAYDSKTLKRIYLGRIYSFTSASYGWSQVGGTTLDLQYLDWTTSVNTSVWDTLSAAATLNTAGSKATKLRIHPGARLKILPGGQLTDSDSTIISEARGLWIAAGTGTGGVGNADGSFIDNGIITYNTGGTGSSERYLSGNRWHYVSSPMSNATSLVYLNDYLRPYNEPSAGWGPYIVPTNVALTPMQGYEAYVNALSKTDYYTGAFNTGLESYTLTHSGGGDGWNLLGNPFPSAQDFGSSGSPVSGWTWPALGPFRSLYYLQQDNSAIDYTYSTYIWSTGVGTNGATQYIPSGQGYMVWEDPGTPSAQVSATNQTRVHNGQAFYKSGDDTYSNLLRMTANGNGFNDESVVYFLDQASSNFNGYYDAFKLLNGGAAPSVYTLTTDNTNVAVNVLPYAGIYTTVPLEFSCGSSGNYTLTASNQASFRTGIEIYLEDKKAPGTAWPNLRTNPVYPFSYSTGDDPNRFVLHFTNIYFGINEHAVNAMQIYSYEDYVYVKNITGGNTQGDVFIYDLTGRMMFRDKLQNNLINKYQLNVIEGYYLVSVITPDNTYHQKVYLK